MITGIYVILLILGVLVIILAVVTPKLLEEEQQHNDSEEFYCEFRDWDVTYRKTCKKCIMASCDEDGNFYCPYYKK